MGLVQAHEHRSNKDHNSWEELKQAVLKGSLEGMLM